MDTDRLKYFVAIVDAGTMTQAASLLGISHSGLSKAMSVLEEEIGYQIFRPQGRGLELTERGKVLYLQSQEVLKLVHSLRSLEVPTLDHLRIGLPEALALLSAGELTRELQGNLTVNEMDSGEIEANLLDRKIDFGFTFTPFPHHDLDHLKVGKVTLRSHARRDCGQTNKENLQKYVIPSLAMKDNPLSIKIRDGWDPKLERNAPYQANNLAIAMTMALAGTCTVFIPEALAHSMNRNLTKEAQLIPIDKANRATDRTLFLVKRKDDEETNVMRKAAKVFRKLIS